MFANIQEVPMNKELERLNDEKPVMRQRCDN